MSKQLELFPDAEPSPSLRRPSYKMICKGPNCARLVFIVAGRSYDIADGQASSPHRCIDVQLAERRAANYRGFKQTLDKGLLDHE